RKQFVNIEDPSATLLKLNAIVTDGAVFYINGVEVLRLNLPLGPIDLSTPANTLVSSPTYTGAITLAVTNLVIGTNVLAVEVHQAANNTNSLLFGVEMT